MKFALSLLAAFAVAQDWQDTSAKTTVYSHTLKVDKDGKFKIIQLGDLMNNGVNFEITRNIVSDLINHTKPSLIVITGDTVDPASSRYFESYYKVAM